MAPSAVPSKSTAPASKQRIVPAIPRALAAKPRDKPAQKKLQSEAPDGGQHGVGEGPASLLATPPAGSASEGPADQDIEFRATPVISDQNVVSAEPKPSPDTVTLGPSTAPTTVIATGSETKDSPAAQDLPDDQVLERSQIQAAQRRELPPAFVPGQPFNKSNAVGVPQPAVVTNREGGSSEAMHNPRSSNNSLVLGGPSESVDSPQGNPPPGGPQQHFMGPPHAFQPPMPPNVPFYPNGHSYHLSEPQMGPMYGPAYGQYQYPGFARDGFYPGTAQYPRQRPTHTPSGHRANQGRRVEDINYNRYPTPPYQMPAPGLYPNSAQVDAGREPGRPLSGSFGDMPPPMHPGIYPPSGPNNTGLPIREGRNIGFMPPFNSILPEPPKAGFDGGQLQEYLLAQFGNPECADYAIHLSHAAFLFSPVRLPAHGVLLARSPKLRSLMAMQRGDSSVPQPYPRILEVQISDKVVIDGGAVIRALKYLYGEPLLQLQPMEFDANQAMQFALSYAAAGHFLELDDIIMRGLDIAAKSMRLDNIHKSLAFALDGGLNPAWNQPELPTTEDRGSSSSTDDASAKLETPASAPTYGMYSNRLLQRCVDFLLDHLSPRFRFNPSAAQLKDVPRLPTVAEPRHLRSGSRLSQIRFGDLALDGENEHDQASTIISSVLLSLPFSVLKCILENVNIKKALNTQDVQPILHQIIQERETRRERAANSKDGPSAEPGLEERLWHQVYWQETVEHDHAGEPRLARHRVKTGTSAGTTGSTKF